MVRILVSARAADENARRTRDRTTKARKEDLFIIPSSINERLSLPT